MKTLITIFALTLTSISFSQFVQTPVQDILFVMALQGSPKKANKYFDENIDHKSTVDTSDGTYTYVEEAGNWVIDKESVWLYFGDTEVFTGIFYTLYKSMGPPVVSEDDKYVDYLFGGYVFLSEGKVKEDGYTLTLDYQDPKDFDGQ